MKNTIVFAMAAALAGVVGAGREHGTGTIPPGDGKTFTTVTIPLSQPMSAGTQAVKFVFA